jgi:orotate phosphoribosyltransferase-like protein
MDGVTTFPALGEITKRQRQAIELRDQGKTFREVGEIMGVSKSAARYLCYRGRRARNRPIKEWSKRIAREALVETFRAAFSRDKAIGE